MQAMMEKMRTASEKTGKEIEGVLTSAQKAKLPGVLKQLDTVRGAGIPMGAAPDLNLTPDQLNKLEALSKDRQKQMESLRGAGGQGGGGDMMQRFQQMRAENQKKVDAILTAPQKAALKKYEDAHPRRGFGGGGGAGFGGGGGGRSGGGRPL
jgi:Spy/CpxP family protein refolding chaperone